MMANHGFLGVPVETFEQAGREQLIALLGAGLCPESRVVEIGCGCLRIAYWLVRFLEPGGYCGIEPARARVEYGLRYLFSAEEIARKRPRFDENARFDTSVFGTRFDYFVARRSRRALTRLLGMRRRRACCWRRTFRLERGMRTIKAGRGSGRAMSRMCRV
jgi:hypothetical protein